MEKMGDSYTIEVTPADARDADFENNCDCAVARAVKRQFPGVVHEVSEGIMGTWINGKLYKHERFDIPENKRVIAGETITLELIKP